MNVQFIMGILTSMGGYFGLMIILAMFLKAVRRFRKR